MIGVFDSGVGGLTVVREIFTQLPGYQVLYFGDTARTPYGTKGPAVVQQYTQEAIQLLSEQGAKLIIAACNTASAVSYDVLQGKEPIPLFEVISPAVQAAAHASKNKRIGVIGTNATVASEVYPKLLHDKNAAYTVFQKACPLLVSLVEENWQDKPEARKILRSYLTPLKHKQPDTLILGCTHYPFLQGAIQANMGRRVTLIDPAEETVKKVKYFLDGMPDVESRITKGDRHRFLFSDASQHIQKIADKWLGRKVKLEEAKAR